MTLADAFGGPPGLAAAAALVALGVVAARRTAAEAAFRALPRRAQALVVVVAFGAPWGAERAGLLPGLLADGSTLALALSLVLWVGGPVALDRLVTDRPGGGSTA